MAKYRYGSLVLPELPNWDKTTYPIAYISTNDSIQKPFAYLHVVDKIGYIDTTGSLNSYRSYEENGETVYLNAQEYVIALTEEAAQDETHASLYPGINTENWVMSDDLIVSRALACDSGPYWTNTTLNDQNGNLFLEASDPVPVGDESKKFDLKGFKTGLALGLAGKPLPLKEVE